MIVIVGFLALVVIIFFFKAVLPWIFGIDKLTEELQGLRKDLKEWKNEDRSL